MWKVSNIFLLTALVTASLEVSTFSLIGPNCQHRDLRLFFRKVFRTKHCTHTCYGPCQIWTFWGPVMFLVEQHWMTCIIQTWNYQSFSSCCLLTPLLSPKDKKCKCMYVCMYETPTSLTLLHTSYTCASKPGCLVSHNWLLKPGFAPQAVRYASNWSKFMNHCHDAKFIY